MPKLQEQETVSQSEYLAGELTSDIKYQLIDGHVYAMAGATVNHDRISTNLLVAFSTHLNNSTCEPLGPDVKIKTNANFFYPDVSVVCDFDETQPIYTDSPTIIVEVLSQSTRKIDQTIKRLNYINLPSLQEYVLIEQDYVDVEVVRRSEGWQSKHYFLGDEVTFESINMTISVEDIYRRVKNQEMDEFLAQKQQA